MHSIAALVHTCIALASAQEPVRNDNGNTQISMDNFVDKLIERVITTPIDQADLDEATLAKVALAKGQPNAVLGKPAPMNVPKTTIPSFSALRPSGYKPQFRVEALPFPASISSGMARSQPEFGATKQSMHSTMPMFGQGIGLGFTPNLGTYGNPEVPQRDVTVGTNGQNHVKRSQAKKTLARVHGYRKRVQSKNGRNILKRRRDKGRHELTPNYRPNKKLFGTGGKRR
jgi:large subunit ribosomal protein L34